LELNFLISPKHASLRPVTSSFWCHRSTTVPNVFTAGMDTNRFAN
jgi:hypothetical protein